jgi:DNA repair protein RadC
LLNVFGALENLNQATVSEVCQIKGIGAAKAAQIKSALELGKLMASKPTGVKIKLKFSQAFGEQFSPFLKNLKKTTVRIVRLDLILQLIKDLTIPKGSSNASIVHSREVMTPRFRESATSFALIHNHLSGDPTPSQKYFEITNRLNQTGKIIGIHIVGHIIIGINGFLSFAYEGLL